MLEGEPDGGAAGFAVSALALQIPERFRFVGVVKLAQVDSLHSLATKATSTLSDVPPSGSRNVHRMEDIICKIVTLENEINADIDKLVDLKRSITGCIMSVQDMEYQSLLEKRYLCLMTWEQIAAENGCSVRNIHMMHGEALKKVIVPENLH